MCPRQFTLERFTELQPNEIFVFGSNFAGAHGGVEDIILPKEFVEE